MEVATLQYKPDWADARQRLEAFWDGEVLDRAVIAVTAPRDLHVPVPEPKDDVARHTDPDYIVAAINARFQNTFFGGEALPLPSLRLGYVAYGNPNAIFSPQTVWPCPYLRRSSVEEYQFDPSNRWWQTTLRIVDAQRKDGLGKYLIAMHIGDSPTDVLSNLRGPDGLATDLIDHPSEVRALLAHLTGTRIWMLKHVVRLTQDDGGGPGAMYFRTGAVQCDFSCMLSPRMFRDFVVPELVALARWAGRSFYHLDGANALQHLPTILDIDEVNWVQWVPGAGRPEGLDWPDVLQAIRASGKGMQISVSFERVEEALRTYGPNGLFIRTSAPTEEAARDLLSKAGRWSCTHPWDLRSPGD